MTVSMGVAALLNLLVLVVLAGFPGWLLTRVWLHRLGLSWRVGVGLVLAVLSVLFSNLASLTGYRFWLMLGTAVVVAGAIVLSWLITRRRVSMEVASAFDSPEHWLAVLLFGLFVAPAFVLYVPLDTDAQGFGHIALMVREGGTIDTLAPWHPDIRYLYSPALFVWWAFLSDLLQLPLHQVMLPFSHVMAGLLVLLGADLGEALVPDQPRTRWLMPLMITVGFGLFLTLMDSAYTTVLGFVFVALFLILVFKAAGDGRIWLVALAAIALAATALTHPDTIIILLIGYIPFYATFWGGRGVQDRRMVWGRVFLGIPVSGMILTLPWLARVWPLFFAEKIVSPFPLSMLHWRQLILFHGVLVPLLAVPGIILAVRRRTLPDIFMVTWLVLLVDFAMFGGLAWLVKWSGLDIMRYVYPYSVAWHGPILVYPYLATRAVDWALDRHPVKLQAGMARGLARLGAAGVVLGVAGQQPILQATQSILQINGAFASQADIAAMDYLRRHAGPDALILNYPHGFEGHWVPVIAEREAVEFRGLIYIEQPFFSGVEPYYDRQQALADAYFDPASSNARELFVEHGVDYIIYPQILVEPSSFGDMSQMIRWRWPQEAWYPLQSSPASASWLEPVFERDGAQVWRVLP